MLLGLDLGTTNVKALVSDLDGRPLAKSSCPISLFRLSDGGVEQDIEEIWRATIAAIRHATQQVGPERIKALGVSSQGGAMQVIGPLGRPRGRVISWLDQRGQRFDKALTRELGKGWFLKRIVHGGSWLAIGQLLRLRSEQPQLLRFPNQVGFVGDVIVSRLCGEPAQDGTSAALTLLYDPRAQTYAPDLLRRLGLTVNQLPPLRFPPTPAGELLDGVSTLTGLPKHIPVSPAVHDQYASALGTGATRAGTVMVGTGTAWVLLAISGALPEPAIDEAFVCHHLIKGLWGQILSMVNGGSSLNWALELTGHAGKSGKELDDLLLEAPPGSHGLTFWPFMTPFGAARLAPGTRGRLEGLQLYHRPAHVLRAVVEALSYELNRHLDWLRASGQPIRQLVLAGGAAASRVTPTVLANVTGLPLRCFGGSGATLAGATILARSLLEPGQSLATLADSMTQSRTEIEPGPHASFYQDQYARYLAAVPHDGKGVFP